MWQIDRRHKVLSRARPSCVLRPASSVSPPSTYASCGHAGSGYTVQGSARDVRNALHSRNQRRADSAQDSRHRAATQDRQRMPSNGPSCGAWRPHQGTCGTLIRPFSRDSGLSNHPPACSSRNEPCAAMLGCTSFSSTSAGDNGRSRSQTHY